MLLSQSRSRPQSILTVLFVAMMNEIYNGRCRADATGVHIADARRVPERHAEDMRQGERHAPPSPLPAAIVGECRQRQVRRRSGWRKETPVWRRCRR